MPDTTKKQGFVVVEGAHLNCSLGVLPMAPLTIKHKDDGKYFVNSKKIATWLEDNKNHMNFGSCMRSSPPPACTPGIKWSDYYENAEFGTQKILIDTSTGSCKYKGKVTVLHHGQTAQPSSKIYKKDKKDSYEIFMLSPKVAASKGKELPSVSKIDLVIVPAQVIPANREVNFEIGGNIKSIMLVATVGKKDDKNLVSWAVYKGDTQKDRVKTYLEYGSVLTVKLDDLPEGKTTIFGYGKTPSGDSTKIIINRKHNKLEGISMSLVGANLESVGMAPKKTPIVFTPQYTFPSSPKFTQSPLNLLQNAKWNIKDKEGNILYTSAAGFSSTRTQGIIITATLGNNLTATFMNSGEYRIELEDSTLSTWGMVADKKTLSLKIVSRSATSITNKGSLKIRKADLIHLVASGIKFDYGGSVGLGNRAFWHIQKDSGKTISLGLRTEVKMSVPQLIEEFRKQQVPISNPYGNYKFQIDGEEKNVISIGKKSSDTAIIEVAKNRMESISGSDKIPVGAVVTYKTQALMPLVAGENIRWVQPLSPFITFDISPNQEQATLQLKQPGKAHFSAYLEGTEVSTKPSEKTVEASYISLVKALWCYANGKRRAETGWEEENYIHISLEGITNTPVKVKVWIQHPDSEKAETLSFDTFLLKEIDTSLNGNGSLQASFILDKELKEKIQKIYPEEGKQAKLFFTLEFTASDLLDLSKAKLVHKENSEEIPSVEKQGKNLYLVLDANEDLTVPAKPRITAINFSNEAADDIQVGVTQYGKKHTIWVNTVGMPKEKLVVIVYKQLLKDDMKETYNNKEKAFAVTAQVKKYEAEEVGIDGLLSLDFTPEKKDADGDPQLFYIAVFKEQKNEKDETVLVEIGSQLKSLDSLPFDKELNKDASQVGIALPTLEEGQTPTAEQLKDIVSKFFHFYNPLFVSETGTIEDQQVISPVLVERGESNEVNKKCVCEERIRAYMRMLRVGEGTGELNKSGKSIDFQKGYTTAFGGNTITDLSTHPKKNYGGSTAAGAYQIMGYTYSWLQGYKIEYNGKYFVATDVYEKGHDYIKKYNIPDYQPESQDKLCITLMKHQESGMIELILKGEIEEATRKHGSKIWASLPHEGDNSKYKFKGKPQPATPMKKVLEHYEKFLKEELEGKSGLHLKKGFLKEFGYTCQCKPKERLQFKEGEWHDPVDNPQRTKYNSYGIVKPENGAYGNVRNGGKKYHSGLDLFALPDITPIYAPLNCTIAGITEGPVGGKVVRIKIDNTKELLEQEKLINYKLEYKYEEMGIDIKETDDVYFIYMHLSAIPSKKIFTTKDVGKKIKTGEIIGYTGVTGNADGIPSPHLHLEIATVLDPFNNGGKSKRTNPARFIKLNSYNTTDQDDASKKKHNIKYK